MLINSVSTAVVESTKGLSCLAVPNLWDTQTDRQIEELLNSAVFAHKAFQYSYDCQPWDVRIATNPAKDMIEVSDGMRMRFDYGIFSKTCLPDPLKNHLRELIEGKLKIKGGGHIHCGTLNGVQAYDLLDHVKIAPHDPSTKNDLPKPFEIVPASNALSYRELQNAKYDHAVEAQIISFCTQNTFAKEVFQYHYEGKTYDIIAINNPEHLALTSNQFKDLKKWTFVVSSTQALPTQLQWHLEDLFKKNIKDSTDSMLDLSRFRNYDPIILSELSLADVNIDGLKNAAFDEKIKNIFESKEFINDIFHYQIDGQHYKVRIIHNPESFTPTVKIDGMPFFVPKSLPWSKKYGIFIDKPAPKEFVDHLKGLVHPSSDDWLINFEINNGENVKFHKDMWSGSLNISYCDFYSTLKKGS